MTGSFIVHWKIALLEESSRTLDSLAEEDSSLLLSSSSIDMEVVKA